MVDETVTEVDVVLVEVVIGKQKPLLSKNPASQVQTGIPSNKEAFSAQLHSSVVNGNAILPKHAMQSPKMFLTKLFSQSPSDVVVVVVLDEVVNILVQEFSTSVKPSLH